MRKVKTITQRNPIFLQTAYKYDHLIDLQNDDRFIKSGERFITYNADRKIWSVYRMPKDREKPRRLSGNYDNIISAVYCALQ
jgi:hypothetical protein